MALLEIKDLSISFGGIMALTGLNLSVTEKSILGIIGPNGSGKTTLFNCLTGIYHPNRGDIFFQGKSVRRLSPDRIAAQGMARTFQNLRLFMNMSVLDNILVGRHLRFNKNPLVPLLRIRKEEIRHREWVEEIIDFLDLQAYRGTRVSDCPYGVQKRVELGRALALEPKILCLDEPSAGMNTEEKEDLSIWVKDIREDYQVTILLIEHDMNMVMGISDRILAINHGVKITEGIPREVQSHPEVIKAYLGEGI